MIWRQEIARHVLSQEDIKEAVAEWLSNARDECGLATGPEVRLEVVEMPNGEYNVQAVYDRIKEY